MQSIRVGSAEVRFGDAPLGIATDIEFTFEAPIFPREYDAEFVIHPMCRSIIEYPECDIEDSVKYWDVKSQPVKPDYGCECNACYHIRRLLETMPRVFIHQNKAYAIVYNRQVPKRSYIVCEAL